MTMIVRHSLLGVVSLCLVAPVMPTVAQAAKRRPVKLTVMTRNLYGLWASDHGGLAATLRLP